MKTGTIKIKKLGINDSTEQHPRYHAELLVDDVVSKSTCYVDLTDVVNLDHHLDISKILIYELETDSKRSLNMSPENLQNILYEMDNNEEKILGVEFENRN
jgi:hypothetical protein